MPPENSPEPMGVYSLSVFIRGEPCDLQNINPASPIVALAVPRFGFLSDFGFRSSAFIRVHPCPSVVKKQKKSRGPKTSAF
jgi:hypothetical protein